MGFSNCIEKILKGSKACGISIWINSSDDLIFNSIIVSRKGDRILFSHENTFFSYDLIKTKIPKNLPIYLSIDGRGVLHKIVEQIPDSSPLDLLLPNADIKDFIIQEVVLKGNKKIISASRRENVLEMAGKIIEKGFDILNITLGPFSIVNILKQFEDGKIISLPNYNIFIRDGQIDKLEKHKNENPDFSLDVDSSNVDSRFIVPFSNSLYHFGNNYVLASDYSNILLQKENFRFKRLFQLTGWSILSILFLSLLLNYFLFENYRNKNQVLTSEIGSNKEIINKIEELKIQISKREDLYRNNRSHENTIFAYYIDRIAKDIPSDITLSRLCMAPIRKPQSVEEIIQFQKNKILISGFTTNSKHIDSWIKTLRSLIWVEEIFITNYYDNSIDLARFDLEIKLN